MATKVRKGDRVHVLTGKDAGKQGRVIAVFPAKDRVLVEGVNRVKRHEKVRPSQGRGGQEGGIVTKELAVHLSNVTLVCSTCGPTRVGFRIDAEAQKIRICRNCEADL
jgi:large subunit ribosomal protein L24